MSRIDRGSVGDHVMPRTLTVALVPYSIDYSCDTFSFFSPRTVTVFFFYFCFVV